MRSRPESLSRPALARHTCARKRIREGRSNRDLQILAVDSIRGSTSRPSPARALHRTDGRRQLSFLERHHERGRREAEPVGGSRRGRHACRAVGGRQQKRFRSGASRGPPNRPRAERALLACALRRPGSRRRRLRTRCDRDADLRCAIAAGLALGGRERDSGADRGTELCGGRFRHRTATAARAFPFVGKVAGAASTPDERQTG